MLLGAYLGEENCHGRPQKKMQGGQKHSRDGHLSESYSQVSVSDRVTN